MSVEGCAGVLPPIDHGELDRVPNELRRILSSRSLALLFRDLLLTIGKVADSLHYDPIDLLVLAGCIESCTFHLAADGLGVEFTQLFSKSLVIHQLGAAE